MGLITRSARFCMIGDGGSGLIAKVMFEWPRGKKTNYHPSPPAFDSIVDQSDTVDEKQYRPIQDQSGLENNTAQRVASAGRAFSFCLPRCDDVSSVFKAMREVRVIALRINRICARTLALSHGDPDASKRGRGESWKRITSAPIPHAPALQ